MEINIQSAVQSLPFCRKELFTDVVHNKVYGHISQVWQFEGHILITTDEGRQLFTFDCKPLHQQHALDGKYLDISTLSTSLIDVVLLSPNFIALIDTVGHMMFWRFTPEFNWCYEGDVHICTSSDAEIISVTFIPGCNTVVWCQKQPQKQTSLGSPSASYCICKLQLGSDLDPQKVREMSQSSVFIQDCPPSDVHTMSSNFLFITTQFNSEQVTLHLTFDFANNDLSLFVGGQCINYPVVASHEAVDFQEVAMLCLAVLMQMKPGQGDLGVRSDSTMGQAAVLSTGGQLDVYSCVSDSKKTELSKKVITLSYEGDKTYKVDSKHWFLHRGHVGIIRDNTVNIFRLKDGKHVSKSKHGIVQNVQNVFTSTSPVFLTWILTSEQLFALQAVETKNQEMYTAADKLPDDHLLQTDILRLAHLHELRMHESTQTLEKDLEHLSKKWADIKNFSHHSHISSVLAPYLDEYWRLEALSHTILTSENHSVTQPLVNSTSARDVVNMHMDSKSFSRTAHHAKLLWLSEVYPKELLDYLCQGIAIERDGISPSELRKWQLLLEMEVGSLVNFECVCRLLFRIMPQKLFNFVKSAESVSEQIVGVSAFVRKKQTLMYYKTAWKCLPHCGTSSDPAAAASAKAKLILASDTENCVESALKCLLQHGLWLEAVELVKRQAGSEDLPTYLHISIKALAEGDALSHYATDLFAIMPSWKSLILFYQLASERPVIRQQQLSNSAKDVFCHDSPDVRLGDFRQILLNLIEK